MNGLFYVSNHVIENANRNLGQLLSALESNFITLECAINHRRFLFNYHSISWEISQETVPCDLSKHTYIIYNLCTRKFKDY